MTAYTWTDAPTAGTAADYKRIVQNVHSAIIACGWVETADTGQVNIDTISTMPGAGANPAPFKMYRLNDALQATAPLFMKFEYAKATTTVMGPAVTIGQGTDGAGTVTNVLVERWTMGYTSATVAPATEYPSYASGDGSGIVLLPWYGWSTTSTTNGNWMLAIERSRDSVTGAATGDGFMIVIQSAYSASPASLFCVAGAGGSKTSKQTRSTVAPISMPTSVNGVTTDASTVGQHSLSVDGGVTAPVIPIPCLAPNTQPWISNYLVAIHPADILASAPTQQVQINGALRTYRGWSQMMSAPGAIPLGTSNARFYPCILWEA